MLKFIPARGKKQPAVVVEDPRVPQLRAKLGITDNADDDHYDAKVAEAVRKFQEDAELKPTGILDDKTVNAINSPKRDKQIDFGDRQHGALALAAARPRRSRRSATPMSSSTSPTIRSR